MTYAEITFKDKNPIKRWLQKQRLISALKTIDNLDGLSVICDFGAGNGELCKLLSKQFPNTHIICYEPTLNLLNEAKSNLKELPNISFFHNIDNLKKESIDLIFSLEVFEHLPVKERNSALQTISSLMTQEGNLVIGVPVEIGIPALYKGVFRMMRRYGAFDANIKNVLMSFIGIPPTNRPIGEIAPGFNYHFEHLGFDWRRFSETLKEYFTQPKITFSPFSFCGRWLMPEIYFKVKKANHNMQMYSKKLE